MNWIRLMLHGAAHAWMPSICTKMVDGERLTQLEAYVFGAVTIYDNFMWRYIHSFHDNTLPDSVHASCVLPACRDAGDMARADAHIRKRRGGKVEAVA